MKDATVQVTAEVGDDVQTSTELVIASSFEVEDQEALNKDELGDTKLIVTPPTMGVDT